MEAVLEGMKHNPFAFTVFTATYNRVSLLPRLHESLRTQTFQNFEWIIVDDGSTDDTRQLITSWSSASPFPIRYIWKPNGGKHTAINVGVRKATGYLFAAIDSDDYYVPEALERMLFLLEVDSRRNCLAIRRCMWLVCLSIG